MKLQNWRAPNKRLHGSYVDRTFIAGILYQLWKPKGCGLKECLHGSF